LTFLTLVEVGRDAGLVEDDMVSVDVDWEAVVSWRVLRFLLRLDAVWLACCRRSSVVMSRRVKAGIDVCMMLEVEL